MKEVISIKEVPFSFPFKKHMENATITVKRGEYADYYFMTSPTIHLVYSYYPKGDRAVLLTEFSMNDVYEALESEVFRNKLIDYLGVS